MPSIAMLTTPARSQRTPESAANVRGTARNRLACMTPRRFIDRPEAAHTRNVMTTMSTTVASA